MPVRRAPAAVERDEPLFDATLVLIAARRTAGWLGGGCAAAAAILAALAFRPVRERS